VSVRLAPSILAADFSKLGDEIRRVEAAGANVIHIDIMDGHFVPAITFGPLMIAAVRTVTTLPLDVHLMITEPERQIDACADAGATTIAVHVEATPHLHRLVGQIHARGVRASAAINPATPAAALSDIVADLDQVLVMSVNPGLTGQPFIPRSLQKVAEVQALIAAKSSRAEIAVDGGVDARNAGPLVKAGVSVLIAGAAVFHAPDAPAAMLALRRAAEGR
jgi:ribulose-phosphate 3-epimerase